MTRRKTTEEFIADAINVHGNKYDYSKVEYKDNRTKVKIICPIHGEFEQIPYSHLHGKYGCKKCYGNDRKTREEFIQQARLKHGDKYNYSQVDYINNHTKVKIICPKHGVFEQLPTSHLHGKGCFECMLEGFNSYSKTDICKNKILESKIKNNSLNTSKLEEQLYELLSDKFGRDNVIQQYKNNQLYPFKCDFYIKSQDLFIELNAFWMHGHHWFDKNNVEDLKVLNEWTLKSQNQPMYGRAIEIWTESDPLKKKIAEMNHLNYLVFWDNDLIDALTWLDSI